MVRLGMAWVFVDAAARLPRLCRTRGAARVAGSGVRIAYVDGLMIDGWEPRAVLILGRLLRELHGLLTGGHSGSGGDIIGITMSAPCLIHQLGLLWGAWLPQLEVG